jgi:hypothetical protein
MSMPSHAIIPFPDFIDREAFGTYVSSMTDCEGHFSLTYTKDKRLSIPMFPQAAFVIGMRADEIFILRTIQSFFGCGHIYFMSPGRPQENPKVVFKISKTLDLWQIVVPHFEKYPSLAKKKEDFRIWRDGVELIATVVSGPTSRRPGQRGGTHPRWSTASRAKFDVLHKALIEQRKFHLTEEMKALLPPPQKKRRGKRDSGQLELFINDTAPTDQ